METAYLNLLENLEKGLTEIDQKHTSRLARCVEKINFSEILCNKLRKQYFEEPPSSEEDQIKFFKSIKPRFFSELHFQIEAFTYYRKRPKGSIKIKKTYIKNCLDQASDFLTKYHELHSYIKLNATDLDELYFTRKNFDPKLHGELEYPTDLVFSSPADPTLSRLLAMDRYILFLKNELYSLKNPHIDPSWDFMKTLDWNGSKTDMVELIYALHSSKAISGELKDIIKMLEKAFNLELGNFYRTFTDIKYKKNPTSFLDGLKNSLLDKINSET